MSSSTAVDGIVGHAARRRDSKKPKPWSELGAALRRANRRTEAREQLRAGVDLAHRCAAATLLGRWVW